MLVWKVAWGGGFNTFSPNLNKPCPETGTMDGGTAAPLLQRRFAQTSSGKINELENVKD